MLYQNVLRSSDDRRSTVPSATRLAAQNQEAARSLPEGIGRWLEPSRKFTWLLHSAIQQLASWRIASGCERAALGVLLRIRRPHTVLPRPRAAFGILEEVRRDVAEAVRRRPRPRLLAAGGLRAGVALASAPACEAWRDGARQVQVAARVLLVEAFPRAFFVPADDLGGAGSPMVPRLSGCQNTHVISARDSGWGGVRSGCAQS